MHKDSNFSTSSPTLVFFPFVSSQPNLFVWGVISLWFDLDFPNSDVQHLSICLFICVSTLNIHCNGWIWSWSSNTLATWCKQPIHWKRSWCWERLKAGGEGDDRGWNGWIASPTQWTWIWTSSERQWRTEKPGVLQSMGSQRVRHDFTTKQQQQHVLFGTISSHGHFSVRLFVFLLLSCRNSSCSLDTNPLSDVWFENIFSSTASCLFTVDCVLWGTEMLNFDVINLSFFFLFFCCLLFRCHV